MKKRFKILLPVVSCVFLAAGWMCSKYAAWHRVRTDSIKTLQSFCRALDSGDSSGILEHVVLPKAIADRTPAEQCEFLVAALHNELSPSGIEEIKRRASFGPLKALFPDECSRWAALAKVKPEDCVAFKMERAGVCAEIVLVREDNSFRVVRCNNVKQMADIAER